jgi:ABC-type sugar transport system substrate-binding protein
MLYSGISHLFRETWHRRTSLIVALAIAIAAFAFAGCGGDDDDEGEAERLGAPTEVANQPPPQLARQAQQEMMSLGGPVRWEGAESSPPPAEDVTAAVMPCSLALEVCRFIAKSFEEGAAAIGWDSEVIDGRSDPATEQRAVDAALNEGVDCIVTFAAAVRDIRPQLERARSMDVPVVEAFAGNDGDIIIGLNYENAGAALAAFVIEQGGGEVLVTNIPQLPELTRRTNGFVGYIEKFGGQNTTVVDEEDFTIADIGPGQEAKMRAMLERNPNAEWVYGPFDGATYALMDTARQAGHPLKGVSFDGDPPAYADIRAGPDEGRGQLATISWGLDWVAWSGIDECNRAINDEETEVNKDHPIELTVQSNVPPPDVNVYVPSFDFKKKFQQLWGVD